jgi:hypothetical protein
MAYSLEVNHPDFPKGFEFDCDGILVKNGNTVKISKDEEQAFLSRVGRPLREIYGHKDVPDHIKLTGTTELAKTDGGE